MSGFDFDKWYENITYAANRAMSYVKTEFDRMTKESAEEFKEKYSSVGSMSANKRLDIFNSVIESFYNSYTPRFYDRNYSLYSIYDPVENVFTPYNMTPYRDGYSGEDGLFQTVFMEGWHGGAKYGDSTHWGDKILNTPHPSPGTPYYRKPATGKGKYRVWGRMAEKYGGTSPYDELRSRMPDAGDGGSEFDTQYISDMWQKEVNEIGEYLLNEVFPEKFNEFY